MTTDGDVLVVENIIAGYDGSPIVNGVSISCGKERTTVLLGPNGAGKSTLVKAIYGLVSKYGGRVLLRGEDITNVDSDRLIRKGMAYVPQNQNVFPSLTVIENLEIGGHSLPSQKVRGRTNDMLDLFPNLRRAARRNASTLSGGERSLLALARGLMPNPDMLLVDEPTAGLSPMYEEIVWEHMDQIRRTGVSILIVEQNVQSALQHADWAYVLVLGQTRIQCSASELLDNNALAEVYTGYRHEAPP